MHPGSSYGARTTRLILCLFQVFLLTGLASAQTPSAEDRVQVFYPKGSCETGWIDLEVYDRDAQVWLPHPDHPRISVDTCQHEDPGILLQELRVRCADPANRARVSPWRVGAEVFKPVAPERCQTG